MCTRTDHDGACETCARTDTWVDLLTEIRDRLPQPEGVKEEPAPAVYDPDLVARNLEAFKHELETPMREHGECCARAEKADPDTVTLRRDDVAALWGYALNGWDMSFEAEERIRAALGWGDSDDA